MRFNKSCSIICSRKLILFNFRCLFEIFKPCGYFLSIKKKSQRNSGKFKVTQESFWSLREDFLTERQANPEVVINGVFTFNIVFNNFR